MLVQLLTGAHAWNANFGDGSREHFGVWHSGVLGVESMTTGRFWLCFLVALYDRSINWACQRGHWPFQAWRRRLPDQSTMSRAAALALTPQGSTLIGDALPPESETLCFPD